MDIFLIAVQLYQDSFPVLLTLLLCFRETNHHRSHHLKAIQHHENKPEQLKKEQSKNIVFLKSCNYAAGNCLSGFYELFSVPRAYAARQYVAFRRLSYSFLAVW